MEAIASFLKVRIMKIELTNSTPDPIVTPRGSNNNNSSTPTNQVQAHGEDTASLSFDRASIGSLVSQAMALPGVRQDKVDALRQAISSGQYKVEPDKVADAMLQESPKS
jgi:negative regulator of flagellin synthesis FlgM